MTEADKILRRMRITLFVMGIGVALIVIGTIGRLVT